MCQTNEEKMLALECRSEQDRLNREPLTEAGTALANYLFRHGVLPGTTVTAVRERTFLNTFTFTPPECSKSSVSHFHAGGMPGTIAKIVTWGCWIGRGYLNLILRSFQRLHKPLKGRKMTKTQEIKLAPMTAELIEVLVPVERDENVNLTLASSGVRLEYQLWRMGAVQSLLKLSTGDRGIKHWSKNQCLELRRALMECAAAGAIPTQHAFLTPFWSKDLGIYEIKVLSSYRFVIERLATKGVIIHPPQLVHESDVYEEEHTYNKDGAQIAVKFVPATKDRGPVIAAFVCWTQHTLSDSGEILASNTYTERKERDYFDKIKQFTEQNKKGARSGPFADEMWRVSLVHRVRKWAREGLPVLSGDVLLNDNSDQEQPGGAIVPVATKAVDAEVVQTTTTQQLPDAGKEMKEKEKPANGRKKKKTTAKKAPEGEAAKTQPEQLEIGDPGDQEEQPATPEGDPYESPF